MKKGNKTALVVIVILVVALGLLGSNNFFSFSKESAEKSGSDAGGVPCINPALPVPDNLHIHPHLQIIINGQSVTVPANIGIGFLGCERTLHTHDDSGTLHIEPNFPQTFTLGQFFIEWGKTFTQDQIFDYTRDANHEIVMTVDGVPSNDFDNLILKDKQQIIIEYRKVGSK